MFTPRPITLPYKLHDYQELFRSSYQTEFLSGDNADRIVRILYSSPTGSGKSLMFLSAMQFDPFAWGITPRIEIISGMLEKCGENVKGLSTNALVELAFQYRISTPVRFRNLLAKGTIPFRPYRLIFDEAHHITADTYEDIKAYLPYCAIAGLTATPFRGTPKSTRDFMEKWDKHLEVMSIPQAAERGVISIPSVTLWPLVDDDEIEITNGEFSATTAGEAGMSRATALVERIRQSGWVRSNGGTQIITDPMTDEVHEYSVYSWDRPTIIAVSSQDQAYNLQELCDDADIPTVALTQETGRVNRELWFRDCVEKRTAIIQIDVVSEGVDLPVRRIIDIRSTFSPVRWLQLVGRCTRPRKRCPYHERSEHAFPHHCYNGYTEPPPEYVCCNRNLERHAYLMCGMIPPSAVATSQTQFGTPSRRGGARGVGLEGLGRLQAVPIKFRDGSTGAVYNLYSVDGFKKTEIAILLHPCQLEPISAIREIYAAEDGTRSYGRWKRVDTVPDVTGYSSSSGGAISDKQKDSWTKNAQRYGLDASVIPTRKNIQAYYLLRDLNIRMGL